MSSLDVELTQVANRLIEEAHLGHCKLSSEYCHVEFRLSPDCTKAFYCESTAGVLCTGLILDLCKRTFKTFKFEHLPYLSSIRQYRLLYPNNHIHKYWRWSEDSRLLGLSFNKTTDGENDSRSCNVIDCESESADDLFVLQTPGTILDLRWVSHNNYNVCVTVDWVIHFYNVCFVQNCVEMRELCRLSLKFGNENKHISSMCFDRLNERYYVHLITDFGISYSTGIDFCDEGYWSANYALSFPQSDLFSQPLAHLKSCPDNPSIVSKRFVTYTNEGGYRTMYL